MNCQNCNVTIINSTDNCPLCGKHLLEDDSIKCEAYPKADRRQPKKYSRAAKILLFISIILTIFLFTINLLTPHIYLWSIVPVCAVWMAFLIVGQPIIQREITPGMIIRDNVIISAFLVIIDVTFNQNTWAMSYVVPFVLSGSSLIVTIIVMSLGMTRKKFYLFQLSIAAICLIPLTIRIFFSFVVWPSIVSALYGLVNILGMVIFGDKDLKYETKKRLHF